METKRPLLRLLNKQAQWRYGRTFWLVIGLVLSLWLTGVVLWWILRFLYGLFSN